LIEHPRDVPPAAAASLDGDNGEPLTCAEMAPAMLAPVAPATAAPFGGPRAKATPVVSSPVPFQWWATLPLSHGGGAEALAQRRGSPGG